MYEYTALSKDRNEICNTNFDKASVENVSYILVSTQLNQSITQQFIQQFR
jgi:hypothetical protein